MRKSYIRLTLKYLVLIAFAILFLYPFLWIISGSLKDQQDLFNSISLIPHRFVTENYPRAFIEGRLGQYYLNSIIIAGISLLVLLVATYLASYALVRIKVPGSRWIMTAFVGCMMVPMQVIVIPLYKLEAAIHINNTYLGLIFPYIAGTLPFAIFVMTAFLKTIPMEIEESGLIDGCNRFQILYKLLLPLSKPGFATVLIFSFMTIWNEFFLAMIIMQDKAKGTLNVGLMSFKQSFGGIGMDPNLTFAALTMISLPVIIVYAIFQRQFISGLVAGSVKA